MLLSGIDMLFLYQIIRGLVFCWLVVTGIRPIDSYRHLELSGKSGETVCSLHMYVIHACVLEVVCRMYSATLLKCHAEGTQYDSPCT